MTREEDAYWAAALVNARRTQLETVRKAATGWAALLSAGLTLFGAVSLTGGSALLAGKGDTSGLLRTVAVTVATLAALTATLLAGAAANSWPRISSDLTINGLRDATKRQARAGVKKLRWAMRLGGLSLALIVVVSLSLTFSSLRNSSAHDKWLIVSDGAIVCGTLQRGTNGETLLDGRRLGAVSTVMPVAVCP